ncbi:chalcone isomerase family protein [Pseudazoarcus pumilus]|uniref:Chalcone isomerase domain-containing protein n=1 Tax=Pseudazoarcus pumilus TaxID=2067960 RepID=A0A2I6S5N8_9RHOO|nr:chalcone isomerase family protein [Pseudazoarcus pumilus]AUN94567.1 hypothetical protein C0099_06190 [Pseudazoarcus pumilus]
MSIISSSAVHKALSAFALLLAVTFAGASTWQTPDLLGGRDAGWRMVGEGQMRWLGFRIYDASLWATDDAAPTDGAFALEIRYHRDIASTRLVDTSLDEMRRLGVAEESRIEAWRDDLEAAFPDVVSGDVIVGVREADGSAVFYHRGERTVRIEDADFADAFFAIWLDERTREPGLREALLGRGDDG